MRSTHITDRNPMEHARHARLPPIGPGPSIEAGELVMILMVALTVADPLLMSASPAR